MSSLTWIHWLAIPVPIIILLLLMALLRGKDRRHRRRLTELLVVLPSVHRSLPDYQLRQAMRERGAVLEYLFGVDGRLADQILSFPERIEAIKKLALTGRCHGNSFSMDKMSRHFAVQGRDGESYAWAVGAFMANILFDISICKNPADLRVLYDLRGMAAVMLAETGCRTDT